MFACDNISEVELKFSCSCIHFTFAPFCFYPTGISGLFSLKKNPLRHTSVSKSIKKKQKKHRGETQYCCTGFTYAIPVGSTLKVDVSHSLPKKRLFTTAIVTKAAQIRTRRISSASQLTRHPHPHHRVYESFPTSHGEKTGS